MKYLSMHDKAPAKVTVMAKIFKNADAPDGTMNVSVGPTSFELKGNKRYETEDPAVIEAAVAHPFLEISYDAPSTDAAKEMEAVQKLHDAQDAAKQQHAEKDPLEPAAEVPQSVADLKEKK